jgi:2-oxoglutarate dehydrogenase E1 component
MLLPHGYEGQGPDHSSARIERFLALCAEGNVTVACPSSPATYFHLLRRQVMSATKRPLVVFTPKSMLRLKAATSAAAEFTSTGFRPVIGAADGKARVLLTSGKVHYDLAAHLAKSPADVALVRLEQLYPLPADELRAAVAGATEVVWVQEEPANQGAWPFMALHLPEVLGPGVALRRVSRKASASPATGSQKVHEAEQQALVEAAFG